MENMMKVVNVVKVVVLGLFVTAVLTAWVTLVYKLAVFMNGVGPT